MIGLGFEPRTHSLEGCCSIQLSYLTILFKCVAKVGILFEYTNIYPAFLSLLSKYKTNSLFISALLIGEKLIMVQSDFSPAYCLFPRSQCDIAELDRAAFALQADMTFFHLVCSGILIYAINIYRDHTVFDEDVGFVPFSSFHFA